jgi:hypothetical protein
MSTSGGAVLLDIALRFDTGVMTFSVIGEKGRKVASHRRKSTSCESPIAMEEQMKWNER